MFRSRKQLVLLLGCAWSEDLLPVSTCKGLVATRAATDNMMSCGQVWNFAMLAPLFCLGIRCTQHLARCSDWLARRCWMLQVSRWCLHERSCFLRIMKQELRPRVSWPFRQDTWQQLAFVQILRCGSVMVVSSSSIIFPRPPFPKGDDWPHRPPEQRYMCGRPQAHKYNHVPSALYH